MSFSVMLQQLAGGMLVSIEIFFVTFAVFSAAGTSDLFWQNVQKQSDPYHCIRLHIHHERNAADAAADGGLFRALFLLWHQYHSGIQHDCGVDWIFPELCRLFRGDLQRRY